MWVWEYPTEGEDGQTGHHDLFMDPGEEIRFRVTSENFVDTSPTGVSGGAHTLEGGSHLPTQGGSSGLVGTSGTGGGGGNVITEQEGLRQEEKRVPFHLKASINEPGLGLLSWWNNS